MPAIINMREMHCYRALDTERDRTSFIYAASLADAKRKYVLHHGIDPETAEWRYEGKVSE